MGTILIQCAPADRGLLGDVEQVRPIVEKLGHQLEDYSIEWIADTSVSSLAIIDSVGKCVAASRIALERTQNDREAIGIDYNSMARNGDELVMAVTKQTSAGITVLGSSLGLLGVFGTKQAFRLATGSAKGLVQAIKRKDGEGAFQSGLLTAVGTGYVVLSLSAGVIGGSLLAEKLGGAHVPAEVMSVASQALTIAGTGMYAGVALYALAKFGMDVSFGYKLRKGLSNPILLLRDLQAAAKKNPAAFARRTSGYLAQRIASLEIGRLGNEEALLLIEEVAKENFMQIIGDVLLFLVGAIGVAAFFITGPFSFALFLVVGILWLCAMDDSKLSNRVRYFLWEKLGKINFKAQYEGARFAIDR